MWMMALYITIVFVIVSYISSASKEKKLLVFSDDFFSNLLWTIVYSAFVYMCACFIIALFGLALLTIIGAPLVIVCIIMWLTGR